MPRAAVCYLADRRAAPRCRGGRARGARPTLQMVPRASAAGVRADTTRRATSCADVGSRCARSRQLNERRRASMAGASTPTLDLRRLLRDGARRSLDQRRPAMADRASIGDGERAERGRLPDRAVDPRRSRASRTCGRCSPARPCDALRETLLAELPASADRTAAARAARALDRRRTDDGPRRRHASCEAAARRPRRRRGASGPRRATAAS